LRYLPIPGVKFGILRLFRGPHEKITPLRFNLDSTRRSHWRRSRWWWVGAALLFLAIVVAAAVVFAVRRAEPILRARIVETLSARFHGPVELAALHVSVRAGLQVSGEGLKIFGAADPNPHEPGVQPLISAREFRFTSDIPSLLHTPMKINRVYLRGLDLNIPPKSQRQQAGGWMEWKKSRIRIFVDDFVSDDADLIINTPRPDKPPLEFAITNLEMHDIGPGQPLRFTATLINPKPVGRIQSTGLFGPWQPDDIRNTPVQGDYTFSNADLGTIKGIGGILSSSGSYHGNLDNILVDGTTNTPDFRLTISGHPVPLQTRFHAIVDGTSGDTYLQPVNAKLMNSTLTASGSIVRMKDPKGHRILLDVVSKDSRIDDLLRVAVRADPAIIGKSDFRAKLEIEPGSADISDRLRIAGDIHISGARFTNEKIQSRVEDWSERTRGKPKMIQPGIQEDVRSDMDATFVLNAGLLSVSQLHFEMPGTKVSMSGTYKVDGSECDFHGKADLDAKLSQMVTGWKSLLLKPVDPFFSKNGAGTEVPISVTGTKSDLHFGLDFHQKPPQSKKTNGN
jgi:hypothetical protein